MLTQYFSITLYPGGIFSDITELQEEKNRIEELNKDLQTYYVAVEQNSLGIVFIDKAGYRRYVNRKYLEITGFSYTDVLDKKAGLFIEHKEKFLSSVNAGKTVVIELYREVTNKFYGRFIISPVDNKGEIQMYVVLVEDITQEKEQKMLIELQHRELENAHQSINESINYAKIIQENILPKREVLSQYFSDNLLIYKPRDVVGGDFYYINKIKDYIILSVADCTGHGIPGAFISMLGYSLLNDIVSLMLVENTAQALDMLRVEIKKILGNYQGGLDIALCGIKTDTGEMMYSGAYSPLYIIRNGELLIYKATRNPIGYYPKEVNFELNTINLQENDIIYLFSDGYIDQIRAGKDSLNQGKFTRKRFKELLLKIYDKPLSQQEKILEYEFENWRNGEAQTDDITIMAVKWTKR